MTRVPKARKGSSGSTRDRHMDPLTDVDRSFLSLSQQTTKVRIGGESQNMTILEAVTFRTAQTALEGNSHAQWVFLDQTRDATRRTEEEKASQRATLADLFFAQVRRIRAAESSGRPTDRILPHPDDIDYSIATGPAIRGPITAEDWADCLATVRLRDAWLVQDALDRALQGQRRNPKHVPFDSGSIAMLIDHSLPRRLRLSDDEWVHRRWHLTHVPMRQILKDCRAAWLACGIDIPRGTLALSPRFMQDLVTLLFTAARRVREAKDQRGVLREVEEEVALGIRQIVRAGRAEGKA